MRLFKNTFFYTSLLSFMILGLIIGNYVFGWTTPSTTPPGGNITPQWTTSGSNIYYNLGNVGIGTVSPGARLHVENADTYYQVVQKRTGSDQALWSGAVWNSVGSFIGSNAYYSSSFNYIPNYTAASGIEFRDSGNIEFFADAGLTSGVSYNPTERMIITSDGKVGIGTSTPAQKLSVIGTIESTTGGFKFPDGSIQTVAATAGPASPACILCVSCGGTKPVLAGRITVTAWQGYGWGSSCGGSYANQTVYDMYLCCSS